MKSKMIVAKTTLLWLGEAICPHKQKAAQIAAQKAAHTAALRGTKTADKPSTSPTSARAAWA